MKRRDVKGKGEKERYTHLNAEFQRRARRDKKAFLSDQCKEIEENYRMGKTRDLFKKIMFCPMSESLSGKREGFQDNATRKKKGSLLLTQVRAPAARPTQWYGVRER